MAHAPPHCICGPHVFPGTRKRDDGKQQTPRLSKAVKSSNGESLTPSAVPVSFTFLARLRQDLTWQRCRCRQPPPPFSSHSCVAQPKKQSFCFFLDLRSCFHVHPSLPFRRVDGAGSTFRAHVFDAVEMQNTRLRPPPPRAAYMTGEEEQVAHAEFEERNNRAVRKLLHCLNALKMRSWVRYEWFYAGIDREYFNHNDFVALLREKELDHIKKATRVEWGEVRSILGKRRRLSPAFFKRERAKLAKYREVVRATQQRPDTTELPRDWKYAVHEPIKVGQCVTAYCRRAQLLQRGQVLTADYERSMFRVQFERGELQSEICRDVDISVHGVPPAIWTRRGGIMKLTVGEAAAGVAATTASASCSSTPQRPSNPFASDGDSPSGIFSGGLVGGVMDSAALATALQMQLPSIANNPEHSLAARTGTQLQRTKQVHLMVQLVKLLDRKAALLKALRQQNDRAEEMQRAAELRQSSSTVMSDLEREASSSSSSSPSSPKKSIKAAYSREFQKECSWIVNNIEWNNENISRVLLGLRRLTDAPPASCDGEPFDLRGLGGLVTGKDGGLVLDTAGAPSSMKVDADAASGGGNKALLGIPIHGVDAPVIDEIEAALARDAQREEEVSTWISNHLDDFGRSARLLVQHTRSVMRNQDGESKSSASASAASSAATAARLAAVTAIREGDTLRIAPASDSDAVIIECDTSAASFVSTESNAVDMDESRERKTSSPPSPPKRLSTGNPSAARSTAPPPGCDGHDGKIDELVASCVSLLLMTRYCVENRDLRSSEIERAANAALARVEPLWHRRQEQQQHRGQHEDCNVARNGGGDFSLMGSSSASVAAAVPISSSPGRPHFALRTTDPDTPLQSWHPDSRPPMPRDGAGSNISVCREELERTSGSTARLFAEIQASIALLKNEIRGSTSTR
jgi:hypothetical protein